MNFDSHVSTRDEFRFSEITSLTGIKPYVLRFWESEFSQINPALSEDGHKIYKQEDLQSIEEIKDLLFNQNLSIAQAKLMLDAEKEQPKTEEPVAPISQLEAKSQSLANDLKMAEHKAAAEQASSVASRMSLKKQWLEQNAFSDQDVVRLVQAKKKLNKILTDIDTIITDKGW